MKELSTPATAVPLPWRYHFCNLTSLTVDSGKPTGLPACTYPPHTTPNTHTCNTKNFGYSKDNNSEVWSTAGISAILKWVNSIASLHRVDCYNYLQPTVTTNCYSWYNETLLLSTNNGGCAQMCCWL